jgi:Zn-dependent protease with chaperone function
MIDTAAASTIVAWLATYLVHSSLLLGLAWIAAGVAGRRRLGLQETIWKVALVAPLVTASLQSGLTIEPVAGRMTVPGPLVPAAEPAPLVPPATVEPERPAPIVDVALPMADARPAAPDAGAAAHRIDPAPVEAADSPPAVAPAGPPPGRRLAALVAWVPALLVAAMILGGSRVLLGWARLRTTLRRRRPLSRSLPAHAALARRLDDVAYRSGMRRRIRLSLDDGLAAPIAFGVVRPEICVPERVLDELGPSAQDGMLAHEVAHHRRRDPAWLTLAHAIERVLFIQPLNRLAVRRLRELAEYACDASAVQATGDRLALARCLAEVAAWLSSRRACSGPCRPASRLVAAMAGTPSSLGRRIGRLLDETWPAPAPRTGWRRAAAVVAPLVVLAGVTLTAPAVGIARTTGAEEAASPDARPAPAPVTHRVADVPPETDIPRPSEVDGLFDDLATLQSELDLLRDAVVRRGDVDPRLRALLVRMTDRARAFTRQRDHLVDRLPLSQRPTERTIDDHANPDDAGGRRGSRERAGDRPASGRARGGRTARAAGGPGPGGGALPRSR